MSTVGVVIDVPTVRRLFRLGLSCRQIAEATGYREAVVEQVVRHLRAEVVGGVPASR